MSKWTKEDILYLEDNYKTQTGIEIGLKLGRSKNSISKMKGRLKLKLNFKERSDRVKKYSINKDIKGDKNPNWKGGITNNYYHYKKLQTKRYPERVQARRDVYEALKYGRLAKKPCITCGDINVQAHHEDYSKPLDVVWYCIKHHNERHEEIYKENPGRKYGNRH